jgi:hypothetical protein
MREVEPRLKPSGLCGCGCGLDGVYRVKPWASNGVLCVKHGCKCRQCQGKRNKTMGAKSQRRGKKKLGLVSAGSIHTGHEENDSGWVRWENKYGASFTGPVFTAYAKAEAQSEAQRPIGDLRPFIFRSENARARYGLITFRDDRLEETVEALARQLGLIDD